MADAPDEQHPFLIYLLGSPGVGKYTVASEIAAATGAVVVDNQLINHPVMALFAWDGVSILPREIWQPIATIRGSVLTAMADLAPRSISYVLTNALEDDAEGAALFHRIRDVAASRDAVFLPVLLTCDLVEQSRRVTSPDRRRRLKISDPSQFRDYMASTRMYIPTDPRLLMLDNTDLSARQAAGEILRHVRGAG